MNSFGRLIYDSLGALFLVLLAGGMIEAFDGNYPCACVWLLLAVLQRLFVLESDLFAIRYGVQPCRGYQPAHGEKTPPPPPRMDRR